MSPAAFADSICTLPYRGNLIIFKWELLLESGNVTQRNKVPDWAAMRAMMIMTMMKLMRKTMYYILTKLVLQLFERLLVAMESTVQFHWAKFFDFLPDLPEFISNSHSTTLDEFLRIRRRLDPHDVFFSSSLERLLVDNKRKK